MSVTNNGLFIFNVFFSPHWKAYIDDREIDVYNLSEFHTGIKLDEGKKLIKLIYARELFRDKFKNFFYLK